ncbi:MAG: translation elongation factor Ts [Bacteroidales bacterium]|nr:translation elongation factor Ts [Bacteroidales bacterium]
MVKITAAEVNKLRQQTGAGMMDCKKALVEAEGDFEKATDILRKKGQKLASSRAGRDANEGVVLSATNESKTKAYALMLNCETDFVAQNQEVIDFAGSLLALAVQKDCDSLECLKSHEIDGRNVADKITDMVGKTGEKMELSVYEVVAGARAFAYTHPGNKIAAIAALNKSEVNDIDSIGKDVVMQIAAMSPVAISKDDVDPSVIEKEIEIGKEQARQEGKPEELLEKIAMGKLNKFFKESTLINQEFIKDSKKTVGQMLQAADKDLTVVAFRRVSLT